MRSQETQTPCRVAFVLLSNYPLFDCKNIRGKDYPLLENIAAKILFFRGSHQKGAKLGKTKQAPMA
jgi:hypothetical protein